MAKIQGSQLEAFLLLAFALLSTGAHANPWVFQEIKPLTEADNAKKSNIPDVPVKDVDPATIPTIHIKQDIRDDILGKNTSSTKFKEGVKKLLDFLEAGPKAAGDDAEKESKSPSAPDSPNPKGNEALGPAAKDNRKIVKQNNESLSYKHDEKSEFIGVNSKDFNNGDRLGSLGKDNSKPLKESNSNFLDQQKEPPAIPMRSEIHNNGVSMEATASLLSDVTVDKNLHGVANSDHLSSFNKESHDDKSLKESNSNFVPRQKEPPAIPMRSQINGMLPIHSTASLLHGAIMAKDSPVLGTAGTNMVRKNQIPYKTIPYGATQLLQNSAFTRSKILGPRVRYNPYSALYQRSSVPHYFGNYGIARRPVPMATQSYRYSYNQRRMLPLNPHTFNPALRSNIRLPFYKSAALRLPTYNLRPRPRLLYTKAFVPRRTVVVPQRAPVALFAARSNFPTFRNFQPPHHVNSVSANWNLLGRSGLFKPALRPKGVKYRRMAINDRGRSYNGLSSTRDKVSQKTPLPLPLASIMTAARIVVPARPHTLNGVYKSTVETSPSADPEEKGARAV